MRTVILLALASSSALSSASVVDRRQAYRRPHHGRYWSWWGEQHSDPTGPAVDPVTTSVPPVGGLETSAAPGRFDADPVPASSAAGTRIPAHGEDASTLTARTGAGTGLSTASQVPAADHSFAPYPNSTTLVVKDTTIISTRAEVGTVYGSGVSASTAGVSSDVEPTTTIVLTPTVTFSVSRTVFVSTGVRTDTVVVSSGIGVTAVDPASINDATSVAITTNIDTTTSVGITTETDTIDTASNIPRPPGYTTSPYGGGPWLNTSIPIQPDRTNSAPGTAPFSTGAVRSTGASLSTGVYPSTTAGDVVVDPNATTGIDDDTGTAATLPASSIETCTESAVASTSSQTTTPADTSASIGTTSSDRTGTTSFPVVATLTAFNPENNRVMTITPLV